MVIENLVTIAFGNWKKFQSPQGTAIQFFWSPNFVATKIFGYPTLWQSKKFNCHKPYGDYGNRNFLVAIEG
jgi:hypothetical protein